MKFLTLISLILFTSTGLAETTLSDIEKQLMCMCGCGMVLSSCQCGTAEEFREEIQSKLEQGVPPEQIIQGFVAKYGETVLSAPTKSGFNLTAWITPFAALILGMTVLFLVVREFSHRYKEKSETTEPVIKKEFSKKVDEELKEFL